MAITPWPSGSTKPMKLNCFYEGDPRRPFDFSPYTAAQLSFVVYNSNQNVVVLTGTGTFSILSVTGGIVQYTPAATDSATPGTYYVRIKATVAPFEACDYLLWAVQL